MEEKTHGVNKAIRKGRSETLIARRDEVLMLRFLYYITNTQQQYQSIIEQLSMEFFIAERRIADIISLHKQKLKEIDVSAINKAQLRKIAPLFTW